MRHPIGLTLVTLALLSACGPQQTKDTQGETTATSTGFGTGLGDHTGDHTTGGPASATGTDDGATTPTVPTGESTSSGEPTGDATSTTAATTATATGDDPVTPEERVTKAWWVDGAESIQLRIIQADPEAGICRGVWLTVLDLGPNGFDPVELQDPWHVRHVWMHQNLEDCHDPYLWFENDLSNAVDATGTVVFHDLDDQGKPATIDIDLTGTAYMPVQPWAPAEDTMTATAVPVVVG